MIIPPAVEWKPYCTNCPVDDCKEHAERLTIVRSSATSIDDSVDYESWYEAQEHSPTIVLSEFELNSVYET